MILFSTWCVSVSCSKLTTLDWYQGDDETKNGDKMIVKILLAGRYFSWSGWGVKRGYFIEA
jgi:hypothetical protein